MVGKKDLETEAGNAEFGKYCKDVERYIRSRGFSAEDAEEIAQDTSVLVIRKLNDGTVDEIHGGYFIKIAKYLILEKKRKYAIQQRFFTSLTEDDDKTSEPIDTEKQVKAYNQEKERTILTDCLLECFEGQKEEDQILLWRYSFKKKFLLDAEVMDSYNNTLSIILSTIREIRRKLLPLQRDFSPITKDVRLKIWRLRKKLRQCVEDCIARKKGLV